MLQCMNKTYNIFLGDLLIGTTLFEKADVPMGAVFGLITFTNYRFGYDLIKEYCQNKHIKLVADYPEDKLIVTNTIDELIVLNRKGVEIKGFGNQIYGQDKEGFEISIEGIPYPFFGEEFPNHVKDYEIRYKD